MNILIADDHSIVRAGLKSILSEAFPEATLTCAASYFEVSEVLREGKWDIALLDLNMGDYDGVKMVRDLNERHPGLPLLIVSMFRESQFGVELFRAGASGFVNKEAPAETVLKAVRCLLEGKPFFSESILEAARKKRDARPAEKRPYAQALSKREETIMSLMVKGKTMKEIATELEVSTSTVNTYRNRILDKIGGESRSDIIRYGLQRGL